ncbi:MAG: hypothetical protein ACRD33_04330 [Candidatus Acidiferrales bacterium]
MRKTTPFAEGEDLRCRQFSHVVVGDRWSFYTPGSVSRDSVQITYQRAKQSIGLRRT